MSPSRRSGLPRSTRLPPSTRLIDSEFEGGRNFLRSRLLDRCSTRQVLSGEIRLWSTSEGTSYHQSRLVFCHYAQVRGRNCTSQPLRPSTRLSPRFSLPRYRSTGFWSYPSDSRPFQTSSLALRLRTNWFPCAYVDDPLRLATKVNSPARDSRRNL